MRVFSKRTVINFICALSIIGWVLAINAHSAKADKNVDANVIKTSKQNTEDVLSKESPRLQLSINPTSVSSGTVMCQVTFANKTNNRWYYPASGFLSDYKFIVTDSLGRMLPLTQYGQSRFPLGIDNGFVGPSGHFMGGLAPGKSLTYQFPVNWFYDMTKPGEYIVSVSREVIKPDQLSPDKEVVIKDKPLTITSNSIRISRKTTVINNVTIQSIGAESIPKNQTVDESEIKWGSIINGIQLGISSDDTLTRSGEAVRLHIALRNTLDQFVAVPSLLLGQNVHVKLTDTKRVPVSLTEMGKMVQATSMSLFSAKTIPPHSVLSGDISLDKIYDLSRAGAYSISATAGNSLQEVPQLKSPPLPIRVENNDTGESPEH